MTQRRDEKVDATFYAQVEPVWGYTYGGEQRPCKGAKVVTITQQRPNKPRGGTVLVKLTIRLPAGVFLPLQPEAVIEIPASLSETHPVEITASDPSAPAEPE